jgi:prepilin peptidase CpaA
MGGLIFGLLLLAASVSDIRSRRIPNRLTAIIAVSGMVYAFTATPPPGAIWQVLGGGAVGLLLWLPFWIMGKLGAGDVKLAAAAGTWLGATGAIEAGLFTAVVGGVLAVIALVRGNGARAAATRFGAWLFASQVTRTLAPELTPPERRIPYGVALAAGSAIAAWFPGLIW